MGGMRVTYLHETVPLAILQFILLDASPYCFKAVDSGASGSATA